MKPGESAFSYSWRRTDGGSRSPIMATVSWASIVQRWGAFLCRRVPKEDFVATVWSERSEKYQKAWDLRLRHQWSCQKSPQDGWWLMADGLDADALMDRWKLPLKNVEYCGVCCPYDLLNVLYYLSVVLCGPLTHIMPEHRKTDFRCSGRYVL